MQDLQGKSIAILATHGFEQSELEVPRDKLREVGATVHVISLEAGQINPDLLRVEQSALDFIKAFWTGKKVVAAICHAPWLLVETGIATGRKITSYPSVKTDVINAGAHWEDSPVVTDQGLLTSRNPGDLDVFCEKIAEEISEGQHERRAA